MHIFISYAKADTYKIAVRMRDELRQLANVTVWVDETLEPGESWATKIQEEIDKAQYVIVLLSPDVNRPIVGSQHRSFVLNEIDYAQQENKRIVPVIMQSTRIPVQLAGLQYIDFTGNYSAGMKRLIHKLTAPTGILVSDSSPKSDEDMIVNSQSTSFTKSSRVLFYRRPAFIVGLVGGGILILVAFVLYGLCNSSSLIPTVSIFNTSPLVPSQITSAFSSTSASTLPPTPSLEIAFIVQTLDSNATSEQATHNAQSTVRARATSYAVGTQSLVDQTATATLWTATLTPNITASIQSYRTQQIETVTAQFLVALTATATLRTHTPTFTMVPPTRIITPVPRGFPGNPVTHKKDWIPQYQTINGYEMVLVPVGCFLMGSDDANSDAKPIHQQCFQQPFWIDRYEATNKQYGSVGTFSGDNHPRESVTWFEARNFCLKRSARLPTEREWEYAARSPDNLAYPWGNEFVSDNVVNRYNSNDHTSNVGSRPDGNSWVGAADLSGNVWEWMNTIYQPYPYYSDDGREVSTHTLNSVRVLRGGSWVNYDIEMRSAFRVENTPYFQSSRTGFRCVQDLS